MSDIDLYKNALASSRRALALLDTQIAMLQGLVNADEPEALRVPYFYGALGEDGVNGIPLSPGPVREFVGTIQIQEDAPFVWTHIWAAQRNTGNAGPFASIWNAGPIAGLPNLALSFIAEDSGRELVRSQRENFLTRADERVSTVLGSVFGGAGIYNTLGNGASWINDWSGGNGPQAVELPTDVLLPASGSLTIKAVPETSVYDETAPRLYVTLLGYKLYEE